METDSSKSRLPISLCTFPAKFWFLVNNPEDEAVFWNPSGDEVIINQKTFEMELTCPDKRSKVFKSTNFSSLIRQLNLYGFRKVLDGNRHPDVHHFQNRNFRRGHPELLVNMKRQTKSYRARVLSGEKTAYRAPISILPKPESNTEKTGCVDQCQCTESHQHMTYIRTPIPPRSWMIHQSVRSPFYNQRIPLSLIRGHPSHPHRILSSPTSMFLYQEPLFINPYFTPVFSHYCSSFYNQPDRTISDQYSYLFPPNYSVGYPSHYQTQACTPHDRGNVNLVDGFEGSSEAQHTPKLSEFSRYTSSTAYKPQSYQMAWSNALSTLDPYDITCSVSTAGFRANQTKDESVASLENWREILDSSPKDRSPDRKVDVCD